MIMRMPKKQKAVKLAQKQKGLLLNLMYEYTKTWLKRELTGDEVANGDGEKSTNYREDLRDVGDKDCEQAGEGHEGCREGPVSEVSDVAKLTLSGCSVAI